METYTYEQITAAARQIVEDELARAEREPNSESASHLRGYAAGAWLLWQTITHDQAASPTRREDYHVFKKLLGLPD
jgi:homoserine kinase